MARKKYWVPATLTLDTRILWKFQLHKLSTNIYIKRVFPRLFCSNRALWETKTIYANIWTTACYCVITCSKKYSNITSFIITQRRLIPHYTAILSYKLIVVNISLQHNLCIWDQAIFVLGLLYFESILFKLKEFPYCIKNVIHNKIFIKQLLFLSVRC